MRRKGSGASEIIVVRVTKKTKRRLEAEAELACTTLSDVVRKAIGAYLSEPEADNG